jgi:3D (Asp-Asp-Asp) domain-containing protein
MNQQQFPPKFNPARAVNRYFLLKQGVSLVSGLGILSSGLFWTQAPINANASVVNDTIFSGFPLPKPTNLPPSTLPLVPIQSSPGKSFWNSTPAELLSPQTTLKQEKGIFSASIIAQLTSVWRYQNGGSHGLLDATQRPDANLLKQSYPWPVNFSKSAQNPRFKAYRIWATYYHIYEADNATEGYPLLDSSDQPLGPKLSLKDWCQAALQGTVRIADEQGVTITYNFARRSSSVQVNCSSIFPNFTESQLEKTGKVRFKISEGVYGEGTDGLSLVPFRTIAVDRRIIPIGSVVYIPAARGVPITLSSNQTAIHDGYFYAADVGHLIQENHIDVFLGASRKNPFPFVTSRKTDSTPAYLIKDAQISEFLKSLHNSKIKKP